MESLGLFTKSVPNGGSSGPLNVLSLDARRSKCSTMRSRSAPVCPNAQECALARHPPIQMHFPCAQMRSRSTLADQNAFRKCSDALSFYACRSKRVSLLFRCAPGWPSSLCTEFINPSCRLCAPACLSAMHLNRKRISNRGAQPGRAKRGAMAERSEAFWPSEARRYPEPREGRQGKLEATQLPRLGCRELARGG